jgi:hypothetical protein
MVKMDTIAIVVKKESIFDDLIWWSLEVRVGIGRCIVNEKKKLGGELRLCSVFALWAALEGAF